MQICSTQPSQSVPATAISEIEHQMPRTQQTEGRIRIPSIVDLGSFESVHERNAAITAWYHEADLALTEFMGSPPLPSWARFAQHASYSAGVQLRNMEEAIQAIDAVCTVMRNEDASILSSIRSFPRKFLRAASEAFDLLRHRELIGTLTLAGAIRAGADGFEIDERLDNASTKGLKPFAVAISMITAVPLILRICRNLPKLCEDLRSVHGAVSDANAAIYDFMAPRLVTFLEQQREFQVSDPLSSCELTAAPARATDETAKFMDAALHCYAQARQMALCLGELPPESTEALRIRNERTAMVAHANVLVTFGEQLYRVQPRMDEVSSALEMLTTFMAMRIGDREVRLASGSSEGSWANLYDRMGIDSDRAPRDPLTISPESFPPLRAPHDPRYVGTISDILLRGTYDSEFAGRLLVIPPAIVPARRW